MITPVTSRYSERKARKAREKTKRSVFFAGFAAFAFHVVWLAWMAAVTPSAHDFEHTQVLLTFARDGSFIVDVANDPAWLKLRLEPFTGSFADRVVLWVDGKEIRATSVEYLPASGENALATHRLRGRMPIDAHTLRWYYGLVIDPYPLTIRRADGRVIVEDVRGDAWSRAIDLNGQFDAPRLSATTAALAVAALFLIPIAIRLAQTQRDTMDTKDKPSNA
jgi:hypothetical protein